MVDKILTKETNYNDSLATVNELQNQIDIYDKDISELEIKLKKLKNEAIIQENDEKTISTVPSNIIQEDENKLIKEEQKLINEEKILKEKLTQINLIYRKIMENIDFFISELKTNQDTNIQEEKIIKKYYNFDDTNENFFQQATAAGQSTNNDQQSTTNANFNITKTTLTKPVIMTTTSEDNFQKVKNKFLSRGTTPKIRIFDDIKIPSENLSVKDDSENPPTEKDKNVDQNKIIPGFNQENDSLFDDLSNADEIVKNYNDYLNWLNKKFDKFFLCYNKEQFKAVMAEKGISSQLNRIAKIRKTDGTELTHKYQKRKVTKKGDAIKRVVKLHTDNIIKEEKVKNKVITHEVVEDEDDFEVKPQDQNQNGKFRRRHKGPSNDIFIRFLEEQENKNNEFIHEKELLKRNRK